MNLIRGLNCLFPCPRCFVPKEDLADLSLRYPPRTVKHTSEILEAAKKQPSKGGKETVLKSHGVRDVDVRPIHVLLASNLIVTNFIQNAFTAMDGSDYHAATSYDPLHSDPGGIWDDHTKPQLMKHIASLGRQGAVTVDLRYELLMFTGLESHHGMR